MAKKLLKLTGGQKIPGIGFGSWMTNKKIELEKALHMALDCGYRYFDTAYDYQNEKLIGDVLKKWIRAKKIKREDVFIATKLPLSGLHEERVGMFMKNSLDNLQMKYVNLYMIQFPVGTNITNPGGGAGQLKVDMSDHLAVWRKLEDQLEAGKTKAIGLSNFNHRQITRILKCARIKPACLQVELHVFMQQKELVELCHKNDIAVIAYAPLGRPYNKFLDSMANENSEIHSTFEHPVISAIAGKYQKTPEQIMLRYLMDKNIVPIPMSISLKNIKQNIELFDFELKKIDIEAIDKLDKGQEGRVVDSSFFPEAVRNSPEFPFPERSVATA